MRPYQNYRRVEISTADPTRIIVLLYEGAIKNLNQAIQLHPTDREQALAKITRAMDIINYLRESLDHEKGGEIAQNLHRLYDYSRDRLNEAIIQFNEDPLNEVANLFQILVEGWRGISAPAASDPEQASPMPPHPPDGQSTGLSMTG